MFPTEKLLQNQNPKLYRRLRELSCQFKEIAEVNIDKIVVEQGIYPRENTDWDTVEIYANAVEEGDMFPPMIVVRRGGDGTYLLVDGNHRYWAHKKAGVQKVWVEIWDIPEHLIEYVATICNVKGRGKNGRDLKGGEKKKEIIQAWQKRIIKTIEEIAEDFETSVSYVRKILSQAGLIKSRKEEMKERAKELREQGLSYREIAKKLEEEFGEKIDYSTISLWFKKDAVEKFTQVKNSTPTPTVRSTLDNPERLIEQEEKELLEAEGKDTPSKSFEEAFQELDEERKTLYRLLPPETKKEVREFYEQGYGFARLNELKETRDYWVEQCKPLIEQGMDPTEASEKLNVPKVVRAAVNKKLTGYHHKVERRNRLKQLSEMDPLDRAISIVQGSMEEIAQLAKTVQYWLDEADREWCKRAKGAQEFLWLKKWVIGRFYDILAENRWVKWTMDFYLYNMTSPSMAKDMLKRLRELSKQDDEQWMMEKRKWWELLNSEDARIAMEAAGVDPELIKLWYSEEE